MKVAVYNNYSNADVVSHYLSVIFSGLKRAGHECRTIKRFSEAKKDETIVVSNPIDVIRLYVRGYRHFILWIQGITPEESFLKHKSRLRYRILSKVDRFALRHSKFVFLVSRAMKDFLENKYKITIPKFYIMPCYNDSFNEKMMDVKDKYARNVFAYVGSLSAWQCFEDTISMYKEMESSIPNTFFLVLTKDKDLAVRLMQASGIKNWRVETVNSQDINKALENVKYGFVLRDDCSVNNVATPTKISSYMAAGVIPIVTKALRDITLATKNMRCIIVLNDVKDHITLTKEVSLHIDKERLKNEFKIMFSRYYSDEYHVARITDEFRNKIF